MKTLSWTHKDKSTWGEGPWQHEPDKLQWQDEKTGLACLIVRNNPGSLCGYVGVPEGHPWHGQDYSDIPYDAAEVHGGLTFAGPCHDEGPEERTICHIPEPGEPDNVWWLGFDCAHAGDLSPAHNLALKKVGMEPPPWRAQETYRELAWVQNEIALLAEQISRKDSPTP